MHSQADPTALSVDEKTLHFNASWEMAIADTSQVQHLRIMLECC